MKKDDKVFLIRYFREYDESSRSTFNHFLNIGKICCERMKDIFEDGDTQIGFEGEGTLIEFNNPGVYFMSNDYEEGLSPALKLNHCPFCGGKIIMELVSLENIQLINDAIGEQVE